MDTPIPLFNILIYAAVGLLFVVSLGVVYLTFAEWRDRRRQDDDSRANRPRRAKK